MRLIHSAAGLCMMLLVCSVHTEIMAASQKVNVRAADAQDRAGVDVDVELLEHKSFGRQYNSLDKSSTKIDDTTPAVVTDEDNYEDFTPHTRSGIGEKSEDSGRFTGDEGMDDNSIFTSKQNSYRSSRFIKQGPDDRPDGLAQGACRIHDSQVTGEYLDVESKDAMNRDRTEYIDGHAEEIKHSSTDAEFNRKGSR